MAMSRILKLVREQIVIGHPFCRSCTILNNAFHRPSFLVSRHVDWVGSVSFQFEYGESKMANASI
jgi:hypothetical protein